MMALEQQLSLAQNPVDGEADGVTNGVEAARPTSFVDGDKTPRLPRWTRQEILVLIQGKRVAETRARQRGRSAGLPFGSGQVEPKWASVSSYCKRHGVNRGPVQCRKRWSNLAGDYKKIKEWESQVKEETESFWVMRNDLRRERKLPGFFDKEVYDILDSGSGGAPETSIPGLSLALAAPGSAAEDTEADAGVLFDSGRTAAAEDGLFSDFEQDETGRSRTPEKEAPPVPKEVPAPTPISGNCYWGLFNFLVFFFFFFGLVRIINLYFLLLFFYKRRKKLDISSVAFSGNCYCSRVVVAFSVLLFIGFVLDFRQVWCFIKWWVGFF